MVRLDPTAKLSFTSAHEKIISSVSGSVFLNWQIFVYVSYLVGIYVKCAWAQCRKFLFSPGRASGGRELRPNRLFAGKAVGLLYYCRWATLLLPLGYFTTAVGLLYYCRWATLLLPLGYFTTSVAVGQLYYCRWATLLLPLGYFVSYRWATVLQPLGYFTFVA